MLKYKEMINISKNLKYQCLNAINSSFSPGIDKHSEKKSKKIGNYKIFSYGSREQLVDFSANFSNYMKENYPEIKKLIDINPTHIQNFFDEKAKTCSQATLDQYAARFSKLEKIIKNTYKPCKNVSLTRGYVVPKSSGGARNLRDISMPAKDYNRLMASISKSKSHGVTAIMISAKMGLRVSECTKLQKRDVDLENNKLKIIDSKGKHSRTLSIKPIDKPFFEGLVAKLENPTDRIVPIAPDSVNKFLRRSLVNLGIADKYPDSADFKKYGDSSTGIHCIRKMAAQEFFNNCRENGLDTKQSLSETSVFLGHGKDRFELMKIYVKNIY